MTTFKVWLSALVLVAAAGAAGAQTMPKALPWAVGAFTGPGDWPTRLPQLLARGWVDLSPPDEKLDPVVDPLLLHHVSVSEAAALKKKFLDDTVRALDVKDAQLRLDLDKKRLAGPLPATEPDATNGTLAADQTKKTDALGGTTPGADPPDTLELQPVWAPNRDGLPWDALDRRDLGTKSKALYLITGHVRLVGTYLAVKIELYSSIEDRILASWEGNFAPDEAADRMVEASDSFRTTLLGRPWAGISVSSTVQGARIKVHDQVHDLPWSSDLLDAGTLDLNIEFPGQFRQKDTVVLTAGTRTSVDLKAPAAAADVITLETDPPGAFLYVDSQYVGVSPLEVPRPFNTTRVRAQLAGWETQSWEIGPGTVSPSLVTLSLPGPHPSVAETKDRFYWSLAAFSFSLTTTAFLGAWSYEQNTMATAYANAYANYGTQSSLNGYNTAYNRWNLINNCYGVGIGLTSALAIWMIGFTLQDYLKAAQASLP